MVKKIDSIVTLRKDNIYIISAGICDIIFIIFYTIEINN